MGRASRLTRGYGVPILALSSDGRLFYRGGRRWNARLTALNAM